MERVALLGIAHRHIRIPFTQKLRARKYHNLLKMNMLTVGDWIQSRQTEKNLTLGHFAEKMGIARTLVRAWEEGTEEPDKKQLEIMAKIFGIAQL